LVWQVDPQDLVDRTERELLNAVHTLLKRLRREAETATRLTHEALEVYRMREQQGASWATIAAHFAPLWPGCSDVEDRVRHAKRYVARVKLRLARAKQRQSAGLTARERGILAKLDVAAPPESTED
jgi:hypothetical protein